MKHREALQKAGGPALKAVLRFASEPVESTRQVEAVLIPAAAALGAKRFKILALGEHAAYVRDQALLRGWLRKLMHFQRMAPKQRKAVLTEVLAWSSLSAKTVTEEIVGDAIVRKTHVQFDGVQALVGEVMARLLSNGAAAGRRLIGECPQCGTYFVRSRKDMKICSGKCRTAKSRGDPKKTLL